MSFGFEVCSTVVVDRTSEVPLDVPLSKKKEACIVAMATACL